MFLRVGTNSLYCACRQRIRGCVMSISVELLSDEDLAKYARSRNAFTRRVKPLPKSRTLERGASHTVQSPDGPYEVDHAGCSSREIPQLHAARKRGVYHKERSRRYLRGR